ncbi:MAG: ATP-binding protein, partial [Paracoccaceae bacterium]
ARSGQEDEAQRRVDITTLLQELCAERGAVWSGGPAACVTGRPVALRRVFGNLIDNALRYAGDAAVSVAHEGAQVVVRVADTGPGIPDDRLAAMFAPFARGDHSRNTQTGGAGLGLSIAQTLVNAHAGQVTLRNGETGGLVAEVRLPSGDQ